jgi:RNA polymerase sigma-70 factor, ECF subfamily
MTGGCDAFPADNRGNFLGFPASKSMSSLSGAQFEAELPPKGETPQAGAAGGRDREIALLMKARGGDRAAYGQIVEMYQDRLFNALLRMVGEPEEARELTQETFARGLEKVDTFRGEASPYTWLFRIGMNLAIGNLRRSQRVRVFSLDGSIHGGNGAARHQDQASALIDRIASAKGDTPAQAAERSEMHQVVLAALGRLDAEYRAVLVMRDVEGFDYQQMADVLALPLGTLKSRLFRARMALKDELGPYMKK